ncbi:hypothetical protein ACSSNL_18405 [Thalassobius sp. S69A]|uniref:hypothetical protein n=1 Tax=unclassified Thalassovita TaxID=2619711 RepID=UPI000C0F43FA|nr:hypothetical protein [Paracoccaceae bacterium]MBA86371.1 hypothetical protein [Paracoccaceae bacterium]MBT26960.1 hypothetical protein [Paracoccaceae bacterium]
MADEKILVLGFSVTAERPGFVGVAKEELERRFNAEVVKAGLGGLQPYHSRYLFPQIIDEHDPDILILDHATPAFRNFYNDQEDYRLSLLSVLRECQERGIRMAMIDFPRTDVDYKNDWVSKCHDLICGMLDVPYRRVDLKEGVLRDEVHTTEYGSRFYADILLEMVPQARELDIDPSYFADVPRYDALRMVDALPGRPVHTVDRGGYRTDLVRLPAGETVNVRFDPPRKFCGFTALMGPRTGALEIKAGPIKRRQVSYDQFCYYERMGAFVVNEGIKGPKVDGISVTQSSEIPTIDLLKGEKNTDSRIGAIGHIFTERPSLGRKDSKMKFLVFGFSVTGEVPGYVEKCAEICADSRPDYEVTKIGIGGLQPNHARHLVDAFLRSEKPDALIIEFSTAAYRTQNSNDYRIKEQQATLQSILRLCKENKVRLGVLDLPLTGVNPDDDWVADTNRAICKKHRVPRVELDLKPELLWDNVHPTDEGKEVYAKALLGLLDKVNKTKPLFRGLTKARKFSAYAIPEVDVKGGFMREFSRHGYVADMLAVPEGQNVTVTLPKEVKMTALIVGIGPKSSMMVFQIGKENQILQCFDQFCYYERVGGRSFTPVTTDKFVVAQSAKLPETELLKGVKDTGPRTGGITHILYEEE